MKNKISAIIIDKDYKNRNYSEIKTNFDDSKENTFDLTILEQPDNIFKFFDNFVDIDCIVTIGNKDNWRNLVQFPFYLRKKWIHFDSFNPIQIANGIISTFSRNVTMKNTNKLFSFFTCTYNTSIEKLTRLYNSIKQQTYTEWNWYIIDDSTDERTINNIKAFDDPRITIIKNVSVHGNIGFNKHNIAMICNGDYLVEVDHDDELLPYCLEYLNAAFNKYPDAGFAYSSALELKGKEKVPIIYGNGWGFGEGLTGKQIVNGKEYVFSMSPNITPFSIRTIYAQPNHVRCWKKELYHFINGHNQELSVLDDMDLIIRTFLNTRMIRIPKILYIQYEGDGDRKINTGNTQSIRFKEIQRTVWLLKKQYDIQIHERIQELEFIDTPWNDDTKESNLYVKHKSNEQCLNYIYEK